MAETSFRYDRGVKLPLYARAGIPEVWIVDFTADVVDVYREPRASGYATPQRVRRGGSVPPASFPDIALSADEILLESDRAPSKRTSEGQCDADHCHEIHEWLGIAS